MKEKERKKERKRKKDDCSTTYLNTAPSKKVYKDCNFFTLQLLTRSSGLSVVCLFVVLLFLFFFCFFSFSLFPSLFFLPSLSFFPSVSFLFFLSRRINELNREPKKEKNEKVSSLSMVTVTKIAQK